MSAQAVNRPQTGGCLKCGEKGHWARDCTAPREKWLSRDFQSQQNNGNPQAATQNAGNDPTTEGQENNPEPLLGAAAAARQKQKRPKLTYEDLKKSSGLPEIYHNFPTVFKSNFRGKGHELSDLRRLLEMYKRWQDRVFAHGSFDNFIATVENIGATNIVKKDMSDMRMDLLKTVEDALAPAVEPEAGATDEDLMFMFGEEHQQQQAAAEEEVELAIDSDEELLELAAAPMAVGELAAAQLAGTGRADEDAEMDDDELLELAMQGNTGTGNETHAAATAAATEDEIDDDELLEMAMQG